MPLSIISIIASIFSSEVSPSTTFEQINVIGHIVSSSLSIIAAECTVNNVVHRDIPFQKICNYLGFFASLHTTVAHDIILTSPLDF